MVFSDFQESRTATKFKFGLFFLDTSLTCPTLVPIHRLRATTYNRHLTESGERGKEEKSAVGCRGDWLRFSCLNKKYDSLGGLGNEHLYLTILKLEVQDQSASRVGFSVRALFWVYTQLLSYELTGQSGSKTFPISS